MNFQRATPALALLVLALSACNRDAPPAEPSPGAVAPAVPVEPVPPNDQPDVHVPPANASDARVPEAADGAISWQGYGSAAFGSDVEQVRRAWGHDLDDPRPAEPGGCYYLTPTQAGSLDDDIGFMVEGDRFSRIDVRNVDYTAPGGGKVGMQAAEIEERYAGRVDNSPGKYVAGARTLRVTDDGGSASVLVFMTDTAGRVDSWRIGVPPQIDYVERCG